jgi:hypothetical protein
MSNLTELINQSTELTPDSYLLLGLSTCFVKEDGEVNEVKVIEPIPSAALETLLKGVPTSYEQAIATTIDSIDQTLKQFPNEAHLAKDFAPRAVAAARTFVNHPQSQSHIPVNTTKADFNYSIEKKRILNGKNIVTADDNVRQHSYTHKIL